MKNYLWAGLVIIGLLMPILFTGRAVSVEKKATAQIDQEEAKIPRVYGRDLSQQIFSVISNEDYFGIVKNFTDIGPRHILEASEALTGNNMEARNYIIDQMNLLSKGRMEIQVLGKHLNVLGKLPGYLPGNHTAFAIVGHYDTWYSSIGVNEGGAGIGAILALIGPLSAYNWPLDIYFVASNARYAQWGPFGAAEVANWFYSQGIDFLMVYTVEALLVQDYNVPQNERLQMVYLDAGPSNYYIGQYWADLTESMSKNLGGSRIKAISSNDFPYWNFRYLEATYYQDRGYFQSTIAIESGFADDAAIRTPWDTYDNELYSYYLGKEMTAAIGASIAFTMSREYGSPIHHDIKFELGVDRSKSYYFPISSATLINVSSRWFEGTSSFSLENPSGVRIAYQSYNKTSAWQSTDIFSVPVSQKGIYRLTVTNTAQNSVGYDFHYSYDSDIDGNGVPDSQEYWLDASLFHQDSDSDTISDAYEIILGTNKDSADTDQDLMPDQYEIANGFDPTNPADALQDADGDSLTNLEEYELGTNPLSTDTDSDQLPDAWEVKYGLNPLVDDANGDPDNDKISNLEEYLDGTNPLVANREVAPIPWLWILTPTMVVVTGVAFYAWDKHRERTWSE